MFMVISKWEFDAAHEDAVRESARQMMAEIRGWKGVASAVNVRAGAEYVVAVITYESEAAYDLLVNDPTGPFERAAAEHGIEDHARWVWSERGEVVEP